MVMYNKTKKYSKSYHSSRARTSSHSDTFVKKIILGIIFAAMLVVVIAVVCAFLLNPQKRIQAEIPQLAAEYYEDYFYENLTRSPQFKDPNNFNTIMEKYNTYGLPPIRLSDLLLYANEKNADHRDFLTKYCDENSTIIKFFADPPYGKKDYHTDITYACNF